MNARFWTVCDESLPYETMQRTDLGKSCAEGISRCNMQTLRNPP
jgi:hypothetical protein